MTRLRDCFSKLGFSGAIAFLLVVHPPAAFAQRAAAARDKKDRIIVSFANYVLTIGDLDRTLANYPPGSIASRETKLRLVESLITNKLFSLGARSEGLDKAEDFPKAKARARESALAYAYFERFVEPKFSEEEARRYFAAHKDDYMNFSYARNEIVYLLKGQALTSASETLMKEWQVKQRDDLLKDLDLRTAKDPSLVLAQIGPEAITVGDLQQYLPVYGNTDFSLLSARTELLQILVLERMYALSAKKAGLEKDPEVEKALERSEDKLLASRYARRIEGKITIEDARRYYQTQPEQVKRPLQILVRQIVVPNQDTARTVKARLDKGESFEELAKSLSTDHASAAKGGEIGWVRKGNLFVEIEAMAFSLKPRQVSDPIKTQGGFYIIRVDERLESSLRPFDEVASHLLSQLKNGAIDDERRRLMKLYNVKIHEELLD